MASEFGVIGLGVMGSAYVRNLVSRGVRVSAWSIQNSEIEKMKYYDLKGLQLFTSLKEFVGSLESPRKILMMVTAGKPVDMVIESLIGLLAPEDILIDGGNEWYPNTLRRFALCQEHNIHYCAMGVSGGEHGARTSPCLMFSGQRCDYDKIKRFIEQDDRSFYIGPGASGHFVKMVHNGIEYAILQIIAEIYLIMRNVLELQLDTITNILEEWNDTDVGSYLLGISEEILKVKTADGVAYLVDKIVDSTGANGTGKWTVKEAFDLGVPVPTITAAVEMRHASNTLRNPCFMPSRRISEGHSLSEGDLMRTLLGCMLISFVQGASLLMEASKKFEWGLDMSHICKIWRKDSIISCKLLDPISRAFTNKQTPFNLLQDDYMRSVVNDSLDSWKKVCKTCINYNIAAPAIVASLQYLQTISSMQLGHNLIQAQRDFFGAHCFSRVDEPGKHHHNWRQ